MDDDKFDFAVKVILAHEGGYSNDLNDPGGITNYGITLRFLQENNIDLNADGTIDGRDIKMMTCAQAIGIYKKYWWDKYKYDNINDQYNATKVFDMAVNIGPVPAHKITQVAINSFLQLQTPITVDGLLGDKTFSTMNCIIPNDLLIKMRELLTQHYERLIAANHKLETFRKGWMMRAAW